MTADHEPDDVVEAGPERSRIPQWLPLRGPVSRGTSVLAAALLVVGLAVGYAVGHSQGHGRATPRPTVTVTARPAPSYQISASIGTFEDHASTALIQDTATCATQAGHELQVGINVSNQWLVPVALEAAHVVLPLKGGLTPVSSQWATCGALSGTQVQGSSVIILQPGGSAWLTATLKVMVSCPGAFPVRFSVKYRIDGIPETATLPGFPDLGAVPYTGCSLPRAAVATVTGVSRSASARAGRRAARPATPGRRG